MHRQSSHLCVLVLEMARLQMNEHDETAGGLKSKRMFVLEQIVHVTNWVQNFDPQNISLPDLKLPTQLKGLENAGRNALKDFPKPNRVR